MSRRQRPSAERGCEQCFLPSAVCACCERAGLRFLTGRFAFLPAFFAFARSCCVRLSAWLGADAVCCVAVCFAGTVFSFDAGGVAVCPTPTEQIMTVDRAQGKSFRMLAITIKTASSDHFPDFYASRWAKLFAAGQFSVPRSRAPLSKKMAHYFASILRL